MNDGALVFIIPAAMNGWIGRLNDDGSHDTIVEFAPHPDAILHTYHVGPGVYTARARLAGLVPMEGTVAVEAGETKNVGLVTSDFMYGSVRDTTETMRHKTEHDEEAD